MWFNNTEHLNKKLYRGSVHALEDIFELYWELLFNSANKILKNKDDAKDAVQNVFIDLWKRREKEIIVNLKAYLINAVKYQVFKKLRDNKLKQNHIERFEEILSHNEVEELFDLEETDRKLKDIIEQLPKKCRNVFKLSRYKQLKNKEVAEKLGISIKTVENHITKALRIIRSSSEEII